MDRNAIAIRPDLTVETVPNVFRYDHRSGTLVWRNSPRRGRKCAGQIAGFIGPSGYRMIRYNGKCYPAHRLVWAIVHGRWPTMMDHADGNRLNNRIENLREASPAQNCQNRGMHRNNSSGAKGVSWSKAKGKWRARIDANRCEYELGYFDTKEAATEAYDAAATELHGEFSRTNADIQRPASVPYLTGEMNIRMYDPRRLFRGTF